jgi:hypothetical protein
MLGHFLASYSEHMIGSLCAVSGQTYLCKRVLLPRMAQFRVVIISTAQGGSPIQSFPSHWPYYVRSNRCMNSHDLNREGRRKVEAELLRRGAASVTSTSRGTRRIYLVATNTSSSRAVQLRVKTKQKGSWHSTTDEAKQGNAPVNSEEVKNFWVFVDLADQPKYWIVPEWWIRSDIHEAHQRYIQKHDGHRVRNDESNHHSIEQSRLKQWEEHWEILDIF